MNVRETHCCGIHEIEYFMGNSDMAIALSPAVEWYRRCSFRDTPGAGQIILMDVWCGETPGAVTADDIKMKDGDDGSQMEFNGQGARFMEFVKNNTLGVMTAGPWTINPHHRGFGEVAPPHWNRVLMWIPTEKYYSWARTQPLFQQEMDRIRVQNRW